VAESAPAPPILTTEKSSTGVVARSTVGAHGGDRQRCR